MGEAGPFLPSNGKLNRKNGAVDVTATTAVSLHLVQSV